MTPTLRAADPAADLVVSPTSEDAERMLHAILSTPRSVPPARRRRRRVVVVAAGVAVAAAVAVPLVWAGPSGPSASAYDVTSRADGSVDVAVDFDRFRHPRQLQRALEERHIRAVVLSGAGDLVPVDARGRPGVPGNPPECSRYRAYRDTLRPDLGGTDGPVAFLDSTRFDNSGLRLRPELLPADGTFVIDIFETGGRIRGFGGAVAIGAPPTCLYLR